MPAGGSNITFPGCHTAALPSSGPAFAGVYLHREPTRQESAVGLCQTNGWAAMYIYMSGLLGDHSPTPYNTSTQKNLYFLNVTKPGFAFVGSRAECPADVRVRAAHGALPHRAPPTTSPTSGAR